MALKAYDSTLARIAGNIASGLVTKSLEENRPLNIKWTAEYAIDIAREIIRQLTDAQGVVD